MGGDKKRTLTPIIPSSKPSKPLRGSVTLELTHEEKPNVYLYDADDAGMQSKV